MAFVEIDTSTLVDHAVPGPCCGIYDMPLFVNNPYDVTPLPWRCVFNPWTSQNECVQDSTGTYPTFAECKSACNINQASPFTFPSGPNYKFVEAPEPCFTDMCCPCGCCRNSMMPKGFWVTVENMYVNYSYGGSSCKISNDGTFYAKVGYLHSTSRISGVTTEYYSQGDPCLAEIRDEVFFEPSSSPCYADRQFYIGISFASDRYHISTTISDGNHQGRCVDLAAPQQNALHQYTRLLAFLGPTGTIVDAVGNPIPPVFYPSLGTKIDYSCNCNCVMYVKTNSETSASTSEFPIERMVTPRYNNLDSNLIFIKPVSQTCENWTATYTASDFHLSPFYPDNAPDSGAYLLTGFDWKRYSTLSIFGLTGPLTDPMPVSYDYAFAPRFFFTQATTFDPVTFNSDPPTDHGTKITITPDYSGGPYATCYPIMSAEGASGIMSVMGTGVGITSARKSLNVLRPDRCEYLGKRTEHRGGCNGWQCRHTCDLGLPATPGGYCQTCTSYEADPDYAGKGVAGWLQ